MAEPLTRCGFIAVIGAPNVGKSTLVNALVGSKVAIVSHKVQTTRAPVRPINSSQPPISSDTPNQNPRSVSVPSTLSSSGPHSWLSA